MLKLLSYFFTICILNFNCYANTAIETYLASKCNINSVKNDEYLANKPTSTINNLAKQLGDMSNINVVYGRLFDQNCTPVADATVRIWQSFSHNKLSGKALTNNLGEFIFILPHGNKKNESAKIIITHQQFDQASYQLRWSELKNLEQQHLILDNQWLNGGEGFSNHDPKNIYPLTIALKGINHYKRF